MNPSTRGQGESGPHAERDRRIRAIAHDLNNALSPITMAVSLLRPKVDDEKGSRILTLLAKNARHCGDLVSQIQALVREYEGGPAADKEEAVRLRGKPRRRS